MPGQLLCQQRRDAILIKANFKPQAKAGHHDRRKWEMCALDQFYILYSQSEVGGRRGRLDRVVLENEQAIKKPLPARHGAPPMNIGQATILILLQVNVPALNLPEPCAELLIPRRANAQRQSINEHAYHLLNAGQRRSPPGQGYAEYNVIFTAIAIEKQRPGRLKECAGRQAMLA